MLLKIRLLLISCAFFWTIVVYVFTVLAYPGETTRIIRLTQIYALTALFSLYIALLLTPLADVWKDFPWRKQYKMLRGFSALFALFFGLLHATIAFFGQLGGFEGLFFLSDRYLQAIILSSIALVLLFLVISCYLQAVAKKLSKRILVNIDRGAYLAGILILIHALMLGTHFSDLSNLIPQLTFSAVLVLLAIEALRLDNTLQKKSRYEIRFGVITTFTLALGFAFYIYSLLPKETTLPIGIHTQHIQLAKEAQQSKNSLTNNNKLPGMDGDKTKRYTVSFHHAEAIRSNQEAKLLFKVYDASSGNRVQYFKNIYEKPVHMIVVDSSLTYFNHIHPEVTSEGFVITTQFPKTGEYHIYLDFQPLGAIEQQMAFVLNIGHFQQTEKSQHTLDEKLTKSFGKYQVSLKHPQPLMASELSVGRQLLTFTIKDQTGNPVTTLKPYLSAFGHLIMIRKDTYEYIHVHPAAIIQPLPGENGGPDVQFMPLGLYGPIKPGVYRVFAQFNPDNELFTADFTVELK